MKFRKGKVLMSSMFFKDVFIKYLNFDGLIKMIDVIYHRDNDTYTVTIESLVLPEENGNIIPYYDMILLPEDKCIKLYFKEKEC